MKCVSIFLLSCLTLVIPLSAQVPSGSSDAVGPNSTVITSEILRYDLVKREAVFTTNVLVSKTDFSLKADELTVFYAASGDHVDRILARGNVVIDQPEQSAKSNQAEYFTTDDRMVLTGTPEVTKKNGEKVTGSKITINRTSGQMEVEGRSRMVLYRDTPSTSTTPPPAP